MEYELVRDADVKVAKSYSGRGSSFASVDVGDYHVDFPVQSTVSQFLNHNEPSALQDLLHGGTFFFVDGMLADFRYNTYNGFTHNDETVDQLMNIIGYNTRSRLTTRSQGNYDSPQVRLMKQWDTRQVDINIAGQGGVFDTAVMFGWNPFHQHISTEFNIIRMICANGMVARTPVLTRKVPLINRWEEHLNIASRQLLDRTESHISERLEYMIDNRASVADIQRLHGHIMTRLKSAEDPQHMAVMRGLADQVSPTENLAGFYLDSVYENRSLTSQLPSHLTQFDTYNITTQLRSHTPENTKSTSNALDMMATKLLFSDASQTVPVFNGKVPSLAFFSDPEQAFFGI